MGTDRTPEDDLRVGQWVAIHHDVPKDNGREEDSPFFFGYRQPQQSSVDGKPLKILALSLPFVAVTDGEQRFPVDVRETKLIKLSPKYVKMMNRRAVRHQPLASDPFRGALDGAGRYAISEPAKAAKAAKDETPERACPLCRSRLIERLRDGRWFLACRQCGFEGGPPASKQ